MQDEFRKLAGESSDNDTTINKDQFATALKSVGIQESDCDILNRLFILFDHTGDGQVRSCIMLPLLLEAPHTNPSYSFSSRGVPLTLGAHTSAQLQGVYLRSVDYPARRNIGPPELLLQAV